MTRFTERAPAGERVPCDEPASVLDRILAILDSVKDSDGSIVDHRTRHA